RDHRPAQAKLRRLARRHARHRLVGEAGRTPADAIAAASELTIHLPIGESVAAKLLPLRHPVLLHLQAISLELLTLGHSVLLNLNAISLKLLALREPILLDLLALSEAILLNLVTLGEAILLKLLAL